jgi:hypothetical protein
VRRTFWGGVVFWALLAPPLLHAFLALGMVPSALLPASLGPAAASPAARIAVVLLNLVLLVSAAGLLWWVWRIYRGDPPRRPALPSRPARAIAGALLVAWLIALAFVEPRGSTTRLHPPWLQEPISVTYPYEAEVSGREAVVDVSLWISASGEIQRYEIGGDAGPEFRAAVEEAVAQMRVRTDALGAESFPHEKRLRIPFVRD